MAERRQLGLAVAVAAVTGQSIALGIFLTPATMAKSLGSPLLLAAVWCAMAGMTVCGTLCYFRAGRALPGGALLGVAAVLSGDVLRRFLFPGLRGQLS